MSRFEQNAGCDSRPWRLGDLATPSCPEFRRLLYGTVLGLTRLAKGRPAALVMSRVIAAITRFPPVLVLVSAFW